jgi:methylglyoxal synthase
MPASRLRNLVHRHCGAREVRMPTIAVIAHDNKKADLVAWATFNRESLARFDLVATRHTARLMQDTVGLTVRWLPSGPEGGDAQIATLVATHGVDAVFFFVDPLGAPPHEPDVRALLRVCNVHNVPLASNAATADLMMASLTSDRLLAAATAWAMPD